MTSGDIHRGYRERVN